mmetsp:Transcript_62060/g.178021  ORF Transcript_62060/g.178021 Transcript_62060/m.178021 type:complete len:508 (+) Transcript_62060:146-1669(+)
MRAAQTGLPCGSHVWAAIPVRRARSGLLGEHDLKFLKADGARFVGVHLADHLLRDVHVLDHLFELILRDLAIAILVEHPEGTPSRLVLEVLCACECRCQELRVVDRPRAIRVKAIQDVNEVIRHRDLGLLQAVHELGFAEGSILVLVQCDEVPAELLEVAVLQVLGDHGQHNLFEVGGEAELAHVGGHTLVEGDLRLRASRGRDDPRVVEEILGGRSLFVVHGEHLGDEVLEFLRVLLPVRAGEVERSLFHLLEDLLIAVAEEGGVAAGEDVGDDATTPDVALLVIAFAEQHLRRDVVRGARLGLHWLARGVVLREPEVDDLDLGLPGLVLEQEVLRLDIPVRIALGVQVSHGAQNLLHVPGHVLLAKGAALMLFGLLNDTVEELTAGADLHHEVDSPGIDEGLVELHNVRVVQHHLDVHLLLKAILVLDLGDVNGLDRPLGRGCFVLAHLHLSVRTLSEQLLVDIVEVIQQTRVRRGEDVLEIEVSTRHCKEVPLQTGLPEVFCRA